MAKKTEQIDCRNCNHSDKSKIGDFMIWCNKLKVYRALGLRYCKLAWS